MRYISSTYLYIFVCVILFLLASCSTTKFVPEGQYLLNSAEVVSDTKEVKGFDAKAYVAQKPNFKTFTIFKLPLFLYNLSGQDSTKWVNRTLRNAGEPPVIMDTLKIDKTVKDLTRMMTNKGYLNAKVVPDIKLKKKKADITYNIISGTPYTINDYIINVPDSVFVKPDTLLLTGLRKSQQRYVVGNLDSVVYRNQLVGKSARFDLDKLDQERDRITSLLRHTGYYGFNKEYIGFVADTLVGGNKVNVDAVFYPFAQRSTEGNIVETPHRQYEVESVEIYVDYNPVLYGDISEYIPTQVYQSDGYFIKYGEKGMYIRPHTILSNCFIVPGALYNEMLTTHTYAALSQLHILKNVNISYHLVTGDKLKCIITAVPDKRQGISTEVEGTNSGGFFGVGAGVGYQHRNAFKGSELFKIGLKGAYEMVTPSFSNFDDNYFEIGGETSLTFPRFMLPFLNKEFKRSVSATTKFNAGYTYQRRPGFFTRTVLATGIQYSWNDRIKTNVKHTVDLIDISYVHLPKSRLDSVFYQGLSPGAQRYSFSDQFIVSSGYTYSKTNLGQTNRRNAPIYSFRASIESAGNVLSLAAKLAGQKRKEHGSRELFGTKFAQYLKGTFNYSRTYIIDEKNSFAWHVGGGLAYPYGNYKEIPIQKRFFSGGGNSLRGWSVRKIGPGKFRPNISPAFQGVTGDSNNDNFYYHSGDIKLDMNVEFRSKLFWIIELGAFVDLGNIWTTKEYEGQEGGKFKIGEFYEQIAASWGLGLRLDFNFVLLRLDCGWKAFDPRGNGYDVRTGEYHKTERWPIKHPHKLAKNTAFHIAVGYPF